MPLLEHSPMTIVMMALVLYVCHISICDPLRDNRPFAIFRENRVFGIDRRRIYCRIEWCMAELKKRLLSRVMA